VEGNFELEYLLLEGIWISTFRFCDIVENKCFIYLALNLGYPVILLCLTMVMR